MNHGILITAYKDFAQLQSLIDQFNHRNFFIFIHIDKKSKFTEKQIQFLRSCARVQLVAQQYSVNWASLAHLKCILTLCRSAISFENLSYLHLISGQDYLIQSKDFFLNFFESGNRREFLDNEKLPSPKWSSGRWSRGGFDMVCQYHGYDIVNAKTRVGYVLCLLIHKICQMKVLRRPYGVEMPPLYGGSTWWSLTRECVQYVVNSIDGDPSFIHRLRHCFCAEQLLFQTLVMNSPFRTHVSGDCLRYIDWRYRNGSCPSILDESDYQSICMSGKIFARKFDSMISQSLVRRIAES
jgi:hypothetical protein